MNDFFGKLVSVVFGAGLVIVLIAGFVICKPKFDRVDKLRERREEVEARIEKKRAEIEQLKKDQERLKTDKGFVETVARRNRRVLPGERVFTMEE